MIFLSFNVFWNCLNCFPNTHVDVSTNTHSLTSGSRGATVLVRHVQPRLTFQSHRQVGSRGHGGCHAGEDRSTLTTGPISSETRFPRHGERRRRRFTAPRDKPKPRGDADDFYASNKLGLGPYGHRQGFRQWRRWRDSRATASDGAIYIWHPRKRN